ncbi:MAG: type III pantothenate kinase [Gammaproteobacteria bacterium]
MKLLVDIGNTRLKWIALQDGLVIKRGHLLHRQVEPARWGNRLWGKLRRPSQIVIANVAGPAVRDALNDWFQQRWAMQACFVHSTVQQFGISNGYEEPHTLGVDRWMAMIGCRQLQQCNSVIIDCGTAATIDALRADGQHLGGVILPGLRLMHEALYQQTRQIEEQDIGDVTFLGRNTRDCIWGGAVHAIAATLDRVSGYMANTMAETHPGATVAVLTGGNAEALHPYLEREYQLEPDLIFHGLKAIAQAMPEPLTADSLNNYP